MSGARLKRTKKNHGGYNIAGVPTAFVDTTMRKTKESWASTTRYHAVYAVELCGVT